MLSAPKRRYGYRLPLEVANRAHPVGPDQLKAPDMSPGQDCGGVPRLEPDEVWADKVHTEVDVARRTTDNAATLFKTPAMARHTLELIV